ncbi:MAG TPA: hypothetical protein VEY11_16670 [Pyrinomonadaceae bacterium]|nr:hypothetical protein [Pyrinomonadaceae bacterium]
MLTPPQASPRTKAVRVILSTLAALLVLALPFSGTILMQAKKPISKDGLVKAIRLNGLSTVELVEQIQLRGVAFEITPDVEAEMRAAGARPEVIDAARNNFRAPRPATPVNTATNAYAAKPAPPVNPASLPLSKAAIITALQNGSPAERVEQTVIARGVDFKINPQATREINLVGGTRSLIKAIGESYKLSAATTTSLTTAASAGAPRGPDYDDLTDLAISALQERNSYRAKQLLIQAIKLDPSQPRAYQLLGFQELYGQRNIGGAEAPMRAAIERGGSSVFKVYHDHVGNFSNYCEGSLFITKTGVSFRADNGIDTFEATDLDIKEVKMNGWVGLQLGAFHIKVDKAVANRGNYNFAPATMLKAEAQLIIKLVNDYKGSPADPVTQFSPP